MIEPHHFDPTILREYDIRGVFGETLHEADAHAIGRCFGALICNLERGGPERTSGCTPGRPVVAVGRDGRLSSPALERALVAGLAQGGVDVIRIGLAATPMLYFAEASTPEVQGGIQVTGSHNPRDHNGFKLVLGGAPFFGPDIAGLGEMAARGRGTAPTRSDAPLEGAGNLRAIDATLDQTIGPVGVEDLGIVGDVGTAEDRDVLPAYVARLLDGLAGIDADHLAALRIGWDAGNGAAGPALELLTSQLPGEHHLLFSEVDGRFPNHHPDPTIEANLADLRALVAAKNLDFGVAFDGDGDRIGVIDGRGRVIDADQLLMIHARDVLARRPGATVIADVKASRAVFETVRALGGRAEMAPSGHSHIKSRMKETGALLGGETSGHFFFADDWFGFDDGLYAAVRLIAASARLGIGVTALRDAMLPMHNTPELRFAVAESRKFAVIEEVRACLLASGAQVNTLDGVRVDTADGWWLLRASNTQAALTARAESDGAEGLERLVAQIDAQLAASGVSRTGS
ncbi:phosphomannomutase/phosphoglucomutase [Novosphingobium resinovorum]|uniref:phosphomannomutase/phosphoglucomutase n=1 Tax=Novosphingobium resinovorum TaxID=158500 RepID=UPI002ED242ED|nr:phosphomannomutase/phosphoglucomutase [Novosphingobium resinovorum]